jgi:hypothetical protein
MGSPIYLMNLSKNAVHQLALGQPGEYTVQVIELKDVEKGNNKIKHRMMLSDGCSKVVTLVTANYNLESVSHSANSRFASTASFKFAAP